MRAIRPKFIARHDAIPLLRRVLPPRVSRRAFGSLSPGVRKRIKDYASFGLAERKARTGLQGQANLKAP